MSGLRIRSVQPTDLEEIVRVDEKLTGQTRKDAWRARLEIAALRPSWTGLVAEADGRVVGYLFGWAGESEFGMAGPTGWIDLVGLDPRYRGLGVGRALVEHFIEGGRSVGAIRKVATLIDLTRADVRDFFLHLGLRPGALVQIEKGC